MLFMLKQNWPGEFQRTIRDAKGKPVKVIKFTAGEPVDVTDKDEIKMLEKDVGHALQKVTLDEKGRPRPLSADEIEADQLTPEVITEVEPPVVDAMTETSGRRGKGK